MSINEDHVNFECRNPECRWVWGAEGTYVEGNPICMGIFRAAPVEGQDGKYRIFYPAEGIKDIVCPECFAHGVSSMGDFVRWPGMEG